MRLVLEEQRDHLLAEAKSEILKRECKHLEESGPGFTKNWRNGKEHSEKLILEVFVKWKN